MPSSTPLSRALGQRTAWPAAGALPPATARGVAPSRGVLCLPASASQAAAVPASDSFLSDAEVLLDTGHPGHPVYFPAAAGARSEPALRCPRLSQALALGQPSVLGQPC